MPLCSVRNLSTTARFISGGKMSFIRKLKRNGRIYLAEVENQRDGAKVRQKVIRYIGIEPQHDRSIFPQNLSELKIDGSRVYGSVIALDFVARKINLYGLLGEHAPAIMALVFCHCHDYSSVVKVERWFKKTDLSRILGIKEISEKMLRDAIQAMDDMNNLSLQKSIFENILKFCDVTPSSVVYDVTNTYFTGSCAKLGKQGKDKEGVKGRSLIQIGLIVTKEHGFPIFHQVHPGNIHDSKIFGEAATHLKLLGMDRGIIVYDRGITAKESIWELARTGWKIIAGMPMHRGIKNIISEMDLSGLENYRNRVTQGATTFYVLTRNYKFGSVNGKLAILLNPRRKLREKELRLEKIKQAQLDLYSGKVIDKSMQKFFSKENRINTHSIKREEHLDGLSFIFTNGKFSREEIVSFYFEKDLIEKTFHSLKGILSLRPIRMWIDENIKAHVLICYLAYTLLATFRFLLYKNRDKCGISDISVEEALEELQDVYRVYFSRSTASTEDSLDNSQLYKTVTLTKRQESILRSISEKLVL
jgi:transposase